MSVPLTYLPIFCHFTALYLHYTENYRDRTRDPPDHHDRKK